MCIRDRCVRRRASDAQALELLHQARLGESRRWLGEVLRRNDLAYRDALSLLEWRERLLVLERAVLAFLVGLAIQRKKPGELDHASSGAEQVRAGRLHRDRGLREVVVLSLIHISEPTR